MRAIAVIVVAGAIALAPAALMPFFGDDTYVIENVESPILERNLFAFHFDAPSREYIPWHMGAQVQRRFVRLLPSALLTIEARLFDRNAIGYHLITLLFHLGTCVAIYVLLQQLTGEPRWALVGALVAAVHPAAAEIVGTLNCQPMAVAAAAAVTSVAAWIHFRRTERTGAAVLAIGAALAGVTSYETLVVLPLLIVAFDRALRPAASWTPRLAMLSVLAIYAPIYWLAHRGVVHPETGPLLPWRDMLFAARVDGASYLFKTVGLFDPRRAGMYWLYSRLGEPLAPLAALAIIVAGCLWARRNRWVLAGLIAFAALLAPPFLMRITVSRLNIPTFRQLYLPAVLALPLIGIALARRRWLAPAALMLLAVECFGIGAYGRRAAASARTAMRSALSGADQTKTLGIVRTVVCGYFATFEWRGPILSLAPGARDGSAPTLTALDDHTLELRAPSGFAIPLSAPEPWPILPTERYSSGGVRFARQLLVPQDGRIRLDGATIEIAERNARDATVLRAHLDRPLGEHVFLLVDSCTSAQRIELSAGTGSGI